MVIQNTGKLPIKNLVVTHQKTQEYEERNILIGILHRTFFSSKTCMALQEITLRLVDFFLIFSGFRPNCPKLINFRW
jgi:hypothetical protein